jgi:hypothetical protein
MLSGLLWYCERSTFTGSVRWQNGSWFDGNLTEGRTFSSFGRGATSKHRQFINTNLHLACFLGEDLSPAGASLTRVLRAKAEGYFGYSRTEHMLGDPAVGSTETLWTLES